MSSELMWRSINKEKKIIEYFHPHRWSSNACSYLPSGSGAAKILDTGGWSKIKNAIMVVEYYKILKIENETGSASFASFQSLDNIEQYVMRILEKCATAPVERKYKFSTVLTTTKPRVESLVLNNNIDQVSQNMGVHLAAVEKKSNDIHAQLKGKIPVGILLIALANMETEEHDNKLILIKCDYDEFIAEGTGVQSTGLSIKNQIFKTCIYNFRREADGYTWGDITVSDSTKRSASYWHSTFLELEECISDKQNTINAYSQIKKNILIPIKKDHKPDFFAL